MLLKKTFYTFFFSLLLLLNYQASAHTFSPSNISVDLLSNDQFSFRLETDFIELMQWQLKLKGTGDDLITQVRALSKIQLYKAIKGINKRLQQQLIFYFDNKAIKLEQLYSPNVNDVAILLAQNPDNTNYRVVFSGLGSHPQAAKKLALYFPEQLGAINFKLASPSRALLSSGVKSSAFELKQSNVSELTLALANSLNYIYQGIIHIIPKGLDHILFVLALFLLSTKLSSLLWQVSAFTVAHTVTLALGIFGVLVVPSSIVEPIIALSIAYIAIENIFAHKLKSQRVLVVFIFGLLHGLGFAAVLLEFGLPKGQWLASLLSFNVGVEIGQLLVILTAFVLLGWARNKAWYQTKIATPLSLFIAVMGIYWFIERVFF
ncbi:MAG: HupE/UreJ family protein [Alteromonadaceae bacterium]|nr:HupE/UreJ family protein [Alteromonadaceae bacterium]